MNRFMLLKLNELNKRKKFLKLIYKQYVFKFIKKSKLIIYLLKAYASLHFNSIIKQYYITNTYNLCLISGRSHNILRKFKISRFFLRYKSYNSYLPGMSRWNN